MTAALERVIADQQKEIDRLLQRAEWDKDARRRAAGRLSEAHELMIKATDYRLLNPADTDAVKQWMHDITLYLIGEGWCCMCNEFCGGECIEEMSRR